MRTTGTETELMNHLYRGSTKRTSTEAPLNDHGKDKSGAGESVKRNTSSHYIEGKGTNIRATSLTYEEGTTSMLCYNTHLLHAQKHRVRL